MRTKNKKLLSELAKLPCEICGSRNSVSAHHIITKANQGDDVEENLIPVCFFCHRKFHDVPRSELFGDERFLNAIKKRGFEFEKNFNKIIKVKK